MYIDAILGSGIAFFPLLIVALLYSGSGPTDGTQVVLTVSTFLFAILVGFFIARLNSRFDRIRELAASEDAHFLAFWKIASVYGSPFIARVRGLIDEYYLTVLDYEVASAYKHSAAKFLALYDATTDLKSHRGESSFQQLLVHLGAIELCRNHYAALSNERLATGQWFALNTLAMIIIVTLFAMKTAAVYSIVITVLLTMMIVLILLVIRDLQNLRLSGELILDESAEEVLEWIGRPRYYNHVYLNDGSLTVPSGVTQYRLGTHRPGQPRRIKLIEQASSTPSR